MQMKKDLVSIVVPVYGVEKYLSECIDSILAQTYQSLEVILVNDGSPDNCGAICDAYAARDSRVKVIHKPNGGAASARNMGLDAARGDYICLIDSDDWVYPHYVEMLHEQLVQAGADISVCSFTNVFRDGETANPIVYPTYHVMSQIDFLERFLSDWTSGMATNKMFKADLLEDVRYAEGHKIDDEFFTYRAIMNGHRVVMFDEPLYLYRMRASSVMTAAGQYQERMLADKLEYLELRYRQISERYPVLKEKFFCNLAQNLLQLRFQGSAFPVFVQSIKQKMRRYFLKMLFSAMDIREKYAYMRALVLPVSYRSESDYPTNTDHRFICFE